MEIIKNELNAFAFDDCFEQITVWVAVNGDCLK
jgi:hypothetical protein